MTTPPGELPYQPGVDCAEGELSLHGPLARTRDVVEDPGNLAGREVRIDHQAGPFADQIFASLHA